MSDSFDVLPEIPTTRTAPKRKTGKTGRAGKQPAAAPTKPPRSPARPIMPSPFLRRTVPQDPDQHALKIAEAAVDAWHSGFGGSRREVALGAVATLTMIRQRDAHGPDLAGQILALPDNQALAQWMHEVWSLAWIGRPDLITRARPLFEWLDHDPSDHMLGCARSVIEACLRAGILELCGTDRRFETDMLGLAYQTIYSKRSRDGRGQFFTPSSVSRLMAEMTIGRGAQVKPGERFLEPAAGTGGMFRAAAEVLRERGMDPAQMYWFANDLDPQVAACCAVNMIVWEMGPNVVVGCGDSLGEGNAVFDRAIEEAQGAFQARDQAWETAAAFAAFRTAAMAVDALLGEPGDAEDPDPAAA